MLELKLLDRVENEIKVTSNFEIGHYKVKERNYIDGRRVITIYLNETAPKYTPEIWTEFHSHYDDAKIVFEIQTTSYGSLKMEEFNQFMEANAYAKKVVEILDTHFNR